MQEVLQETMKTLSGDNNNNNNNNNEINVRKENSLTSSLSQDDGCLDRRIELRSKWDNHKATKFRKAKFDENYFFLFDQ